MANRNGKKKIPLSFAGLYLLLEYTFIAAKNVFQNLKEM